MRPDHQQFVLDLVDLKHRAGNLGLYRTMQSLERPTQVVGWEIAGLSDPEQVKLERRYEASKKRK